MTTILIKTSTFSSILQHSINQYNICIAMLVTFVFKLSNIKNIFLLNNALMLKLLIIFRKIPVVDERIERIEIRKHTLFKGKIYDFYLKWHCQKILAFNNLSQ